MNTFRHASLLKSKLERVKQASKYRLYALTYAESPYGWGQENLGATDCSGLLCGPLLFMGFNIRINADGLMRKLFTNEITSEENTVDVIFFIDRVGTAGHCGIFMADSVIMHASGDRGVTFDSIEDLIDEYEQKGYRPITRSIDWAKAYELDGEVYDLDEEMV